MLVKRVLHYSLKNLNKFMNTMPVKATLKSYAFTKCSQKGLDPAMIVLYQDILGTGISGLAFYIKCGVRILKA